MRNSPSQGLLSRTWCRLVTSALCLPLACFASGAEGLAQAETQLIAKDPTAPTSRPASRPASRPIASARAIPTSRPVSRGATSRPAYKEPKGSAKKAIASWLLLGPAPAPMPAFHKQKHGKFKHKDLLASRFLQIARLWPRAGQAHDWFVGEAQRWHAGKATFAASQGTLPQVAYMATYLEVPYYAEMILKLRSHQRMQIFLDGKLVGTKATCTKRPKAKKTDKKGKATAKAGTSQPTSQPKARSVPPSPRLAPPAQATKQGVLGQLAQLMAQQNRIIAQQNKTIARQLRWLAGHSPSNKATKAAKPGKAKVTLRLTPGTHLLVIKSLYTPSCVAKWKVKATLHKHKKQRIPHATRIANVPRERHSLGFLLRRANIGGMALSPDGQQVALWKSRRTRTGQALRWVELRRTTDGSLVRSTRPIGHLHSLQWSPDGKYYSFISYHGKQHGSTLWLVEQSNGSSRALRRQLKQLSGYTWAPNSRFLVLNLWHKEKPSTLEKAGAKRLRGMGDRWPWYRTHNHLYRLTLQGGQLFRLTAGRWGINGPAIRADGKKLLFLRAQPNYKERPFRKTDLFELDLNTLQTTRLLKDLSWINSFAYSPDGKQVLLRGGASLFGTLGHSPDLALGVEPNEYDIQAYIFDIKSKKKQAISKTFKPSLGAMYWHPVDRNIYAIALDGTRYKLYRFHPKTKVWQHIPTHVDLTYRIAYARQNLKTVFLGQGLTHPGQLFALDLARPTPRRIHAPAKQWLSRITLAKVKDFVTTSRRGHRIEGRVYYPPNFDPRRTYPAIVYYYGGTFPTTRGFDGRYPGHLWAAHDFVVYKLQPSGAIGYGQRFAARHVNEWGTIVPEEIIDATKDFLKAHPFVDPKRVGCIGASYGGFTTMSIVTKTSLFAAAISHAGISNITSYWGAGFWGYLYNSISAAKRYPWTHPYFYAKQSPIFSANNITTPLLLLHGDSDTNVPPAESFQMYTALRLLKKKVELILFKRSDHWVLRYKKRKLWTQTILAWFAKHLQKQPLWWKRLHGTQQH